jgi:hypothetical protein
MRFTGVVALAISNALVTGPGLLFAQRDTGAILGTVRDQTGGVIPGARVTIENEGTSLRLAIDTREDGSFIFTPVRIGTYSLEVEYPGFQKFRRTGITVNIQQQVLQDVSLTPGEVTQTVEVTSAVPLLQTQSGSVGEVVTASTINNLPLSGRNFTFLARLTAGVTHGQPEGRGLNASGWFAANGTRPAQNNYLLDGIDNNSNNVDFLSGAAFVLRPPVDAIAEFKLQTSAFSAEFGRAGGAVLNATLKSGTNEFHGSAWEFLRNDNFDAADFFANANRQGRGEFKQNQFGVAAGGRLVRDKTFWFADYEGTRIRQAFPRTGTVPTPAQRASGYTDFSDLIRLQSGTRTDALGRTFPLGTIFDPSTTRQVGPGPRDWVREPFPGNIIPRSRLNPNAVRLLDLYPDATNPNILNGNYFANRGSFTDVNSFDVRIDHNFSANDQVFGRYSFAERPSFRPGPFPGIADGGGFADGDEITRTQGAALSWTHLFGPTLINEARAGFNRERVYRVQPFGDDLSDIPAQFGIQGILQTKGNGGLPALNIGGLSRIGASDWLVSERFSNTIQLSENLTKIYGRHTFKGGLEYQEIYFPWIAPPTSRGSFSFSGVYTSIPEVGDSSTGRAQFLLQPVLSATKTGDQLIGMVNSVSASNYGGVANIKGYRGLYFQDDWKITTRLTLNLGLRWDYFSQVGERFHAQANYVPQEKRLLIPARRQGRPNLSPSFLSALQQDGIELLYTDQYGSGLGISQRTNFAPRFGFALQLTPKWVMRGGYGIYYGAFENRGGFPNLGYNYPFQFAFSFPTIDRDTLSPVRFNNGEVATLETGLLHVPMDPVLVQATNLNLRGIEFRYRTPYVQSYNYMLQYQLSQNQSVEAGYVASLSRRLETFISHNHPELMLPPGTNVLPYLPLPNFQRGSSFASTVGNAHYHSLQTKFTRRVSQGLNFLAAYTWAKTLTNAGDLLSGGNVGGFRAPYLPGFGIKKEMGLASFDVRHAFVFSGTYDLPFGRGRKWSWQGPINQILGGWSTNWILTMYSGQPQSLGCSAATSVFGCYPLVVDDIYKNARRVEQYYNPDAFRDPPRATQIGQADYSPLGGGRTPLIGPGLRKLDFSLFKSFYVKERYRLEFRAESFNLTNTPAFANPSLLFFPDRTSFGRILATRNNPNDARQLQFALKFYW